MTEEQIIALLESMSLDEKIGQLQQLSGDFFLENSSEITGPMLSEHGIEDLPVHLAGSVLGVSGAKDVYTIQKEYMEKHPHHIPLLFMADIIHGYETIFPIPLALASSWNPELIEKTSAVAAKEGAVSGLHVSFAPMLDLVLDPRWGRVLESTGEDPYLASELAKAYVKGFQNPEGQEESLAACAKHFIGYGASEAGRDYNSVDISPYRLRNLYMPAFEASIQAGVKMVMTSFNTWNGIPASSNKSLMRDELRDHLAFDGVLISDWGAVLEAVPHGVAEDDYDAAKMAIEAGVDIEMMTFTYHKHLKKLIEDAVISEEMLDEAVYRILKLKNDLGLFENPFAFLDQKKEKQYILSKEHRRISYEAALESMVLLENREQSLPLSKDDKLAFVGPLLASKDLMGAWSWRGRFEDVRSVEEALDGQYPTYAWDDLNAFTEEDKKAIDRLIEEEAVEKLVVFLGEPSSWSGEAASRSDIRLPQAQRDLYRHLRAKEGLDLIVVLINGRPLDLSDMSESADAILEAFYPGTEGAEAILSILFGDVNPNGKLAMSFPYHVGQVPVYYHRENTGRPSDLEGADPKYSSKYLDVPNEARYPFGHGLTYSSMYLEDLCLEKDRLETDECLKASVCLFNPSQSDGTEVVQWYIRDHVADVVRPIKELVGFEKVFVPAGSSKQICFELSFEDLAYYNHHLEYKSDTGKFSLMVGLDSENILEEIFLYV